MAALTGIEYKGLRELGTYLKAIGADTAEFKQVMHDSGVILVNEARTLAPTGITGRLAQSIKANTATSGITVAAGNNTTVRYAYTFHATELGFANGAMTFHYPGYTRVAPIPSNPFMLRAYENKKQAVFERFVTGVNTLIQANLGPDGA